MSTKLIEVQTKNLYSLALTILVHASVLYDFGRSIGAPIARSMMS